MKLLRFLLMLVVLLLPLPAAADPSFPKLTGRVVDAANLLSPEQEAQLTQMSADVEKASGRQFVVATIPDLQGYAIDDYGYRLGRAWQIGRKDANNGIILIVAPNERKVRIEVGYGLEPIMTDALSSQIINETILPHFRDKDVAGGIVAGAQAIAEQMKLPLEAAEARAKQQLDSQRPAAQTRARQQNGVPFGLIFWGIVLLIILVPLFRRRRRRGPWGARPYRDGNDNVLPIVLWTIADQIANSARRGGGGSGWGGDGGGWGGGGGDDGGFSGGGGSFGGGGASGSW